MSLVTAAAALSKKMVDDTTKRQQIQQSALQVGDSDVAKRAFASQVSLEPCDQPTIIERAPTDIKYEHADEIMATASPSDRSSPLVDEPSRDVRTVSTTPDQQSLRPPPYSPRTRSSSSSSPLSSIRSSPDTDASSMTSFDTSSGTVQNTNSNGIKSVRIKTIGSDLKSGFPYPDSLFELNIHPQKWASFTDQVIEAAKLSAGDQAGAWASATAVALMGAIGTSVVIGRSMTRAAQEKKVKAGLASPHTKLGETLNIWNEEYFRSLGLFVHLELSESAMKNAGQHSKALRKGVWLYHKQEDRARKREERKFVIVVTKLDENAESLEASNHTQSDEDDEGGAPEFSKEKASMAETDGGVMPNGIQELSAEQLSMPVELPADFAMSSSGAFDPPAGYVEMSSDNASLLQKMNIHDKHDASQQDGFCTLPMQTTRAVGNPSAEEETRQLEASQPAIRPQQAYNDSGSVAQTQVAEGHSMQHEQGHKSPLSGRVEDCGGMCQAEFETAGINPYTLRFIPDSNEFEQDGVADQDYRTLRSLIPEPLNVKGPKRAPLYDGADWGEPDSA